MGAYTHLAHVGAGLRLVLLHQRLRVAGRLLAVEAQLPGPVPQAADVGGHLTGAAAAGDLTGASDV